MSEPRDRLDPDQRTRVVPTSFRSSIASVVVDGGAALAQAALARDRARDRYAILVVASWLDEDARPQLRSWLRESAGADGPIAVSIGGHTHSDVGPILGASLRHVLLLADPTQRGGLLDIIDLHSPRGFGADGAEGVRRIETLVPQRLSVGSADLVALVLAPGEGVHEGWARAQQPGVLGGSVKHQTGATAVVQSAARTCEVSVQMPHPLATQFDARVHGLGAERFVTREGVTRVTPRLTSDDTLRLTPTEEELAVGVLIGRDARCGAGAPDVMLSRVHAFVRARGDGMLIVDAGSTHGTDIVEGATVVTLDRGARARVVGSRAHLICGETHVVIERQGR
jgi:hypothetical protein